MDEGDGHAALAHSARYSFYGVVAHVASREQARPQTPSRSTKLVGMSPATQPGQVTGRATWLE